MSKYHGEIGFVNNVETSPGIWETDNMTVREYYGDVIKAIRRLETSSEQINSNPTTNVEISIIGDTYAFEHMYDMRYAVYKAVRNHIQLTLTIKSTYTNEDTRLL